MNCVHFITFAWLFLPFSFYPSHRCMDVHTPICLYVHTHIYMFIFLCIYICVWRYVNMHTCVCFPPWATEEKLGTSCPPNHTVCVPGKGIIFHTHKINTRLRQVDPEIMQFGGCHRGAASPWGVTSEGVRRWSDTRDAHFGILLSWPWPGSLW